MSKNYFFFNENFKFQTITDQTDGKPYLTRLVLGRLRLHWFHRGDLGRELHDHPWAFWTFPFKSYSEEYRLPSGPYEFKTDIQKVPAFKWSYRPATHTHRVLTSGFLTIIWTGEKQTQWGFFKDWRKIPWQYYSTGNRYGIAGVALFRKSTNTLIYLPAPARHMDVILLAAESLDGEPPNLELWEQGFIDCNRQFLTRREALYLAFWQGLDPSKKIGKADILFSEDLW